LVLPTPAPVLRVDAGPRAAAAALDAPGSRRINEARTSRADRVLSEHSTQMRHPTSSIDGW
jgi:hypothetical protein